MFQCVPLKQFIKIMLLVIIMNYCSHKVKNELGHLFLVMTVQKNDGYDLWPSCSNARILDIFIQQFFNFCGAFVFNWLTIISQFAFGSILVSYTNTLNHATTPLDLHESYHTEGHLHTHTFINDFTHITLISYNDQFGNSNSCF